MLLKWAIKEHEFFQSTDRTKKWYIWNAPAWTQHCLMFAITNGNRLPCDSSAWKSRWESVGCALLIMRIKNGILLHAVDNDFRHTSISFCKTNGSRLLLPTRSSTCLSVYSSGNVEKKKRNLSPSVNNNPNDERFKRKIDDSSSGYAHSEAIDIDPNHHTENLSTIFYLLCPPAWQFQFSNALNALSFACKVAVFEALPCHTDYHRFLLLTPAAILLI